MLLPFLRVLKITFSWVKKAFLVFAVYIVVVTLFLHFINKDSIVIDNKRVIEQNRQEIFKTINNPKLTSTKQGKISVAIFRSFMCGMIGEACTNNPFDGDKMISKSLVGKLSQLIALPLVTPQASGIFWVSDGLQNAGFIPKTYAAEGTGFAAIKPFMNIWKVFRDVSYLILVLVIITIGFMIMFRAKINPQTVISVENSLPRIVVSLILITFSFAIAGFLIDLMYALILIGIAILGNRNNFFNIAEFQNKYINANFQHLSNIAFPAGIFNGLRQLSDSLFAIIPYVINQMMRVILGGVGVFLAINYIERPLVTNIINTISEFGGDGTIPVLGQALTSFELVAKLALIPAIAIFGFVLGYVILPLVIFVLVSLTYVYLLFRIFFLLFSTYIKILILIIFAPIILLINAFPGKNMFGFWFKQLFVNLLTFPIVIILMITTYVIVNIIPASGKIWTPPLLTELNPQAFTIMLGMGIFFMIPDLVKMIKESLGVKDLPVSFNLGTFFTGAGAAWGGAQAGVGQFTSLTQMPFLGRTILNQLSSGTGILGKIGPNVLPPTVGEQVVQALKKEKAISSKP